MKSTLRTVLNNVIRHKDNTFTYDQKLVWSKWIPDTNSQPSPFVSVIQTHLSDDLHTSDSTRQVERTGDKPTNEEGVQ